MSVLYGLVFESSHFFGLPTSHKTYTAYLCGQIHFLLLLGGFNGRHGHRYLSVFLTSATASESVPAAVDEEWSHFLYWANIKKKTHSHQLIH